jgi:hypothetical protein
MDDQFCAGLGPMDTWLTYRGTAGKSAQTEKTNLNLTISGEAGLLDAKRPPAEQQVGSDEGEIG